MVDNSCIRLITAEGSDTITAIELKNIFLFSVLFHYRLTKSLLKRTSSNLIQTFLHPDEAIYYVTVARHLTTHARCITFRGGIKN